jgi:D-beta-D-heptose 7-phosphate kinase / D-beta-D-heptose 1-phosphate adenosyltransferase
VISNLPALVERCAGLEVAVIGEAMLDTYLEGSTRRFCQEAPVPIVNLSGAASLPGGAANTAVNVRQLGARAHFLSVLGADPEGSLLRDILSRQNVATDHLLVRPDRRTLHKQRVLASGQMLLRLDQGSTESIDPATEQELIDRLAELFARCAAVIVSDYSYGIITPRLVRALADLQARWSPVLVIDSRRLALFRDVAPTAVKPNYTEAAALVNGEPSPSRPSLLSPHPTRPRAEAIAAVGERILEVTGAQIAAVTLDSEGALIFERGRPPYRSYAQPVRHSGVVGAGDTFTSALALALAAGAATPEAAELASAAAAVVVGKERTATCSAQEVREYLSAGDKYVGALERFLGRVDYYREQGRRIVFTNGCFDILHRGHITYLNRAKTLGDILIVGVNADDTIRKLKGPSRPINNLDDRVQVLAALSCIDHIIPFTEDTPCNLVQALRPDVFVKGGDYTRDRLPEAAIVEAYGGVVQILPLVQDRSTTGIIERIQAHPSDARQAVGDEYASRPSAPAATLGDGR